MKDTVCANNRISINSYIAENDCIIGDGYMVTNGCIGIYLYIISYFAISSNSSKTLMSVD